MKPIFLCLIFTFSFKITFSQGGTWIWISGDSAINAPGVYGTQGVPSVNNHPPGLYEYSEWKDVQGNFWLYGGCSPDYNDLWKYNPMTNEWTWVKGNSLINQQPIFGIKGVPDPANTPGARPAASATCIDTSGNLWLFGGDGYRNDLWKYELVTNEWTWMSGTNISNATGVHGVQGVPSILNYPGGRSEICSAWTDADNNLWLFGGMGRDDAGASGNLNDMMKYDIATNEWTWMSGSALANAPGNYGIKGVSNINNVPSARPSYTKWKDNQGNLWLMGGGWPEFLNDLWKFDIAINEWTWIAGANFINDSGAYHTICVYDTINCPASRMEHRSSVTDNCGRFWLFGGAVQQTQTHYQNDLWVFDPQLLKWNWVGGTNIPNSFGSYGILGVPLATNIPPSRQGAVSWWGDDNKFYLFGGTQSPFPKCFSDMWVFSPDSNCIPGCNALLISAFATSNNNICPGACNDFQNLSINSTSYQWLFQGATPDTSSATNPTNICYPSPGTFDVTLVASNANGSDTLTLQNYITVFPQPAAQSISQSGDTLFAIAGSAFYQWFFNGNIINGSTDYFYVAQASGDYNVVATDANGCEVEAVINNVLANAQLAVSSWQLAIDIFPNPVSDIIDIRGLGTNSADEVSIYNVVGEKVFSAVDCKLPIVNCQLFPGLYYLEILSDKKIYRTKFIKQ